MDHPQDMRVLKASLEYQTFVGGALKESLVYGWLSVILRPGEVRMQLSFEDTFMS